MIVCARTMPGDCHVMPYGTTEFSIIKRKLLKVNKRLTILLEGQFSLFILLLFLLLTNILTG